MLHKFIPQGQWNTEHGTADVIEQDGFGIVGGLIDKTGEGYLMNYLTAAPVMMKELEIAIEAIRELRHAFYVDGKRNALKAAFEKYAGLAATMYEAVKLAK